MAYIGGPIEEVSIAGRPFAVAADADGQRKLGGYENDVISNGNGTGRIIKSIAPPMLGGLTLAIDDDLGDQEFLQEIANAKDFVEFSFTLASSHTYQGEAMITGELNFSVLNATCSCEFKGQGVFTRQ